MGGQIATLTVLYRALPVSGSLFGLMRLVLVLPSSVRTEIAVAAASSASFEYPLSGGR